MHKEPAKTSPDHPRQTLEAELRRSSRLLYVIYVGLMLILMASGASYFYTQRGNQIEKVRANLETIAALKQAQIVQWRSDRLDRAAEITEGAFIKDAMLEWLAEPTPAMTERLLDRFEIFRRHQHFTDVLLVDRIGQIELSLSNRSGLLHEDALVALEKAYRTGQPQINEMYAGSVFEPHIDIIAPLFRDMPDGSKETAGALVMKENLSWFLYPTIQSWPVTSATAETLIVRRDGNEVLFINEVRHQKDSALKLRIPLSQRDVPAVQAALGHEGWVEGRDYRGKPVVAVIKAIPDSTWYIIAKMDRSEAYDITGDNPAMIMAVLLLLTAVASSIALIWLQHINRRFNLNLQASETARRDVEERYRTTLMSIGDAVIAADAQGRIELINPVAEALTAWSEDEARGQPLDSVFKIIAEDTRQPVEGPIDRIIGEGQVVGLAGRSLLVARDGREIPIADSGAPIRDEDGAISGAVLVFRDQSQAREAMRELEESNNKFSAIFRAAPAGIIIIETHNWKFIDVNPGFVLQTGYTREEALGKGNHDLGLWVGEQEVRNQLFRNSRDANMNDYHEMVFKRKDGVFRNGMVSFRLINLHGENVLMVILIDITERRQAAERLEQSLHEKEALLRELYHRTKNNMQLIQSMLSLQTANSDNPEVRMLVQNTGEKIRARALVHQMLYRSQDLSRIDLDIYIHDLANLAITGFKESNKIELDLELEPVQVLVDVATPLGLVINELLTNSLKHAFPNGRGGKISIRLRRDDRDVYLSYADDGVGVAEGTDLRQSSSYGMLSVFNIIEMQLNGTIEVKRQPGLEFSIKIHPEQYDKRV